MPSRSFDVSKTRFPSSDFVIRVGIGGFVMTFPESGFAYSPVTSRTSIQRFAPASSTPGTYATRLSRPQSSPHLLYTRQLTRESTGACHTARNCATKSKRRAFAGSSPSHGSSPTMTALWSVCTPGLLHHFPTRSGATLSSRSAALRVSSKLFAISEFLECCCPSFVQHIGSRRRFAAAASGLTIAWSRRTQRGGDDRCFARPRSPWPLRLKRKALGDSYTRAIVADEDTVLVANLHEVLRQFQRWRFIGLSATLLWAVSAADVIQLPGGLPPLPRAIASASVWTVHLVSGVACAYLIPRGERAYQLRRPVGSGGTPGYGD